MDFNLVPFTDLLTTIIDNRGKTCPVDDFGIPLIATNCVKNDVLYPVYEKVRYVSPQTYKNWFRGHPIPGDLIFVTKGTPGRVCIAPDPVDFCIAQDMVAVRPDPKKVYPLYLFAALRSSTVQREIENMHVGSLIPHFKKGDFNRLFIPVPDIKTQKFIGDLYFCFSKKINLNRKMNRTLEDMARAIFKSWFVDFDPVRAKMEGRQPQGMSQEIADLFPDSFVDSELGMIPKGWDVKSLPEVMEINPKRSLSKGVKAPYLDMKNMPTQGHRPEFWINRELTSGVKFINGDTLMARITPCLENGKTAFVDFLEDHQIGWDSTEYIVFRPKYPFPLEFGYYLVRSEDFKAFSILNMTGSSGRQRTPPNCFNQYQITVCSEEIAMKFGESVKPLMNMIASNCNQFRQLSAIRDTLLPKLMSGEIRVKESEKIAEEVL